MSNDIRVHVQKHIIWAPKVDFGGPTSRFGGPTARFWGFKIDEKSVIGSVSVSEPFKIGSSRTVASILDGFGGHFGSPKSMKIEQKMLSEPHQKENLIFVYFYEVFGCFCKVKRVRHIGITDVS